RRHVAGCVLIIAPTARALSAPGDSAPHRTQAVQSTARKLPAPPPRLATWPVVRKRLHAVWAQAHADLPGLVQSMQPKIGELAKTALGVVASIGGGVLQFLAALIVAGIIMAFGQAGSRGRVAVFGRLWGQARAGALARL